jgi:hypothetical protein
MRTVSFPFQPSLFGSGDPSGDQSFSTLRRFWLDTESWVDLAPGWLTGPDTLFTQLVESAPWQQRERTMYDQRVAEPRLTYGWAVGDTPPPLDELADLLSERYQVRFDSDWSELTTGTGETRWPGTAIGCVSSYNSREWPSCRWALPGASGCDRAAVGPDDGSPWRAVTCS